MTLEVTQGHWKRRDSIGHISLPISARLNRGQVIGASLQKIRKSHSIPISTKITRY